MNNIFKTLGIASDLWVCTLVFFLITTLVSKPTKDIVTVQAQQVVVDSLKKRIKELEKINLAKSKSGETPKEGKQTEIFLRQSGVSLISDNKKHNATTLAAFEVLIQKVKIYPGIVLYCDSRIPFEKIVGIIDKIKQHNSTATISLAALGE